MPTFYLDYEGGNDANDGLSFANRWKTLTSGATAARIAPGDTIRIMASPDPTSLGQTAKWTNGPIGSSKNITAATNASPIVITSASHGFSNNQYVRIDSVAGNTAANGLWKIANVTTNTFELVGSTGSGAYTSGGTVFECTCTIVELTSAVTANIDRCETAWTASANVTATADSTQFKEGRFSAKLVIASAFTTGLAAYRALGSATDFSAYKQVSFWIRNSVAIPNGSSLSLRLCSDALGAVTVDTIAIPAIPSTNQWVPITIDKAAAFGSSIQSVALYVDSDFGAVDIFLDNIIACKDSTSADSLSLTSLIGKNTAGETWLGIQSVNGTVVKLDNHTNALANTGRGYTGTSETVTTHKRETVKTPMAATASVSAGIGATTDVGTPSSLITYSGGWDRTAMTSQSGQSWFDGQNGFGLAVTFNSASFVTMSGCGFVRFNTPLFFNNPAIGSSFSSPGLNNNSAGTTDNSNHTMSFGALFACNNNGAGLSMLGNIVTTTGLIVCNGNLGAGLSISGNSSLLSNCTAKNNGTYGLTFAWGIVGVRGLTTEANGSGGVHSSRGLLQLFNAVLGESTEVAVSAFTSGANTRVISVNHDGTATNHQVFVEGGLISSETSIRKTASGIAWKLSPTSTNRSASYPLNQVIATVAVAANALVTVKAWLRRTNVALTGSLVVRGGQISGVSADVTASMTAIADTWEEVTITFTPTAAGVVEIEVWSYGGTTHSLYVDDLTITQA
jgi:hypothetical protein